MALNDKLLQAEIAAGGLTPSEHFGVVLYEGDGTAGHSINGGKFGAAAYFNGSSGYIEPSGSYELNDRTISMWFTLGAYNSYGNYLLDSNDRSTSSHSYGSWSIHLTSSGTHYFTWDKYNNTNYGMGDISYTFNTNTWYHLVFVVKDNSQAVYVNGVSQTLNNITRAGDVNKVNMNILRLGGEFTTAADYTHIGKIDQVRIFQKALSSSQVSTLYAETVATVESLDPLNVDTTDTLQVLGDTSCTALYRFENDEVDLSGNYNGTGTAIQYAAGRYGQAGDFNGTNSVVTGTAQNVGSSFSVSAWIYPTAYGEKNYFNLRVDSSNLFQIGLNETTNGKLTIGAKSSNTWYVYQTSSSSIIPSLNQWYHIVVNRSSSDLKIYVNGTFIESANNYYNKTYNTFNIGSGKDQANDTFFKGRIDQVRVFNKTLSAAEVTTLYNENPLVASYRFEGNSNDDMRTYNGTDTNVTYEFGLNFTPDFVWTKNRSAAHDHNITDSSRGVSKGLNPNTTAVEGNQAPLGVKSFDTGGFTVGDNSGGGASVNGTGYDYVAWCLKANGGTTSSNSDGAVTTTVQANTDAGFSIVSFSGTGSQTTFGHGLGEKPDVVIIKRLDSTDEWSVYHDLVDGSMDLIYLNLTTANSNSSRPLFTSSVFYWVNSGNYIAYAFKSIDGFSKFGSYTGTGSATDRPIIETNFEPAFVMIKNASATGSWMIHDNKRNISNPRDKYLRAESSNAEGTYAEYGLDFFSNGFQVGPTTAYHWNTNGNTYIYMAFAADPDTEQPTVAKSFSTVAYTGNGGTQSITGLGFSPNLTWIKDRSATYGHRLIDSVSGPDNYIESSSTASQQGAGGNGLSTFDTDGFTLGSGNAHNRSGDSFISWNWKADDNEPTIFGGPAKAVYKFEDNANDVTGTYNGTANSITYATGKFNKAAVFNGSSGDIDLPADIETSTMAVSLWAYLDDNAPTNQIIIEFDNGYGLNFPSFASGKLAAQWANSNANHTLSNSALSNNQWYHIAANFRSGATDLYINGVRQTTGGTASDYLTADQNTIGSRRSGEFFDGMIDQVRIYNGNFQQIQIDELYAETVSDNDDLELGGPPEILVSANANAGFSIAKASGAGAITIPHGLSSAPNMVIKKGISTTEDWYIYHSSLGTGKYMSFNRNGGTDEATTRADSFSSVTATSVTDDVTSSNVEYIMYSFHDVAGYQKFGTYSGIASGNVTVTTGFRPDFVMVKCISHGSTHWEIHDSVRTFGTTGAYRLRANDSSADASFNSTPIKYTSTGFYLDSSVTANSYADYDANGRTYIYWAIKIN